jgi:hypothetical protein
LPLFSSFLSFGRICRGARWLAADITSAWQIAGARPQWLRPFYLTPVTDKVVSKLTIIQTFWILPIPYGHIYIPSPGLVPLHKMGYHEIVFTSLGKYRGLKTSFPLFGTPGEN